MKVKDWVEQLSRFPLEADVVFVEVGDEYTNEYTPDHMDFPSDESFALWGGGTQVRVYL